MKPITVSDSSAAIEDNTSNPQSSQAMTQGLRSTERKKRTRTGCLNCCRRRRKCDEVKPGCTGCKRRGEECQWRQLGSFRAANIKMLEPDHPSMNQAGSLSRTKRQSKFKILNAVPGIPNETKLSANQPQADSDKPGECVLSLVPSAKAPEKNTTPAIESTASGNHLEASLHQANEFPRANVDPLQSITPPLSGDGPLHLPPSPHHTSLNHDESQEHSRHGPLETRGRTRFPTNHFGSYGSPSTQTDASTHVYLNSSPNHGLEELGTLQHLTQTPQIQPSLPESYHSQRSPLFEESIFSDPSDPINDIFLPGSAYEALHTTLRNRQLWTARPDVSNRRSSQGSGSQSHTPRTYGDAGSFNNIHHHSKAGRPFELTPEREHILWQNYLYEICSWVGK